MPARRRRSPRRQARRALLGIALVAAAGACAAADDAAAAAQHYLLYCSGCHQDDGRGSAPNRVPTFAASLGNFVRSAAGRAFLIQVGGVAQSPLDDDAIAALLNWLLHTFGADTLPREFAPYSPHEVSVERQRRPADLAAVRARIADELRAQGHTITSY